MPSDEGSEEEENKDKDRKDKNGQNGKRLSKDFKKRWKRVEDTAEDKEKKEDEEPRKPGLGLFKRKMEERKAKGRATVSFFEPPTRKKKGPEEKKVVKGPPEEPTPEPKEPGVLDQILFEIKGAKQDFIKKRKEELRKEAERPREDLAPHTSKLSILKQEMDKKKKERAKSDLFGVGFTPEIREARVDHLLADEEKLKADLKASMERATQEGSIVKHLDDVLTQPIEAVRDEYTAARSRIIKEIRKMDTKGFEVWIRKIINLVKKGRVFKAENDLVNLKIAIEAKRDREHLKREREDRLEVRLESEEDTEMSLENVVERHIKAIELEMDQTQARIDRDLRKMDTSGFEHVVRNIREMLKEDKVFDAEEQLLELKLALKARRHREELKRYREKRIIDKAHETMPFIPVQDEEKDQEFEREVADLLPLEADLTAEELEAEEVIAELISEEKELPELVPEPVEEEEELIAEVQCGICGTILRDGQTTCPACGTTFRKEEEEVPEVELEEVHEEEVPILEEVEEVDHVPGPPYKPPEPPEIFEIQCGVCGALLESSAKRCQACGTAVLEPELEYEAYPSLGPVEEEHYTKLGPVEDGEFYPELVPIEEKVSYPELAPIEEGEAHPEMVPVDEIRCPVCGELTPADTELCDYCGSPVHEVPLLEPVEADEYPELVPIGPWEDVTAEISLEDEIGVPVVDMMEEIEVTKEVVVDLEAVADEGPIEAVEAEAWVEVEPLTESDIEWRRLVVRGMRLYEEGLVKEALEAYDEALEISPSYEAYFGKGSALFTLGWSNSALDCFNRALDMDGERPAGWIKKAKAQESLSRYGEAVDTLNKAIEVDASHAEAWHMKGTLLMQMGRIKEAVEALDNWVALRPNESTYKEVVTLTQKVLEEGIPEEVTPAEAAEELAAVEEEELRIKRFRRVAKSRGLTNGMALINGRGLINGRSLINGRRSLVNGRRTSLVNGRPLVNGKRGAVNGKGLINGRGLVNGASGLVNGRAVSDARGEAPVVRIPGKKRKRLAAPVAVIIMVIVAFLFVPFYLAYISQEDGIIIDGQFSDWQDTVIYDDPLTDQANNMDVDIIQYGMDIETKTMSFYVKVPGSSRIMNGAGLGVDVLHIFIETDGAPSTGYSIMGIGADHMVEVFGWDGKVNTARLFTFNESTQRSSEDWNGWLAGPSIKAISKGSQLEVQVERAELGAHASQDVHCLLHITDDSGNEDFSDHIIAKTKGVLGLTYDHINLPSVQPDSQNNPFIGMNLTADKGPMEISSITLRRTGKLTQDLGIGTVSLWGDSSGEGRFNEGSDNLLTTSTFGAGQAGSNEVLLTPPEPILVQPGSMMTLFVTIDILDTVILHQTLGLDLDRTDVDVVQGAVTVTKSRIFNSYIGSPSSRIIIDGAFDDWTGVSRTIDTYDDIGIPRIDIKDYRSHFDEDAVSFYLSTNGEIMSGMIIPTFDKTRPVQQPNQTNVTPGPPVGPPDLPELTGGDMAVIYIDADQDRITGSRELGIIIGPDFKMVIEGKSGEVMSSRLFRYDPLTDPEEPWVEIRTLVPAANDRFQLETQVSRDALGIDVHQRVDAFFLMADWEHNLDFSDDILFGNRGQLRFQSLDVIPDSINPGASNVPLIGLELEAESEDIYLRSLSFDRTGNTTDLATGTMHLYLDNGDDLFTPLDHAMDIADSQFSLGTAVFDVDPPILVQPGSNTVIFLATDVTFAGEDETIGVTLEMSNVDSTADSVTGPFPLFSYVSTIATDSDRSTNQSINYTDDLIDDNWGNIGLLSEGYVWDNWPNLRGRGEHRVIPNGRNVRDAEITDDGTWLNFHVRIRGPATDDIHIYLDTNLSGSANYDLVYDITNGTVLLYEWNETNSTWDAVTLTDVDRYDHTGVHLEIGIEFTFLNLSMNQTIKYQVKTEPDIFPGGTFFDCAPGLHPNARWSSSYTTIPEFQDFLIPIAGAIIIITIIRRRRLRHRASKGSKGRSHQWGKRRPRRSVI